MKWIKILLNLMILLVLISSASAIKCISGKGLIEKICYDDMCALEKICKIQIFYHGKEAILIPRDNSFILLYSKLENIGLSKGIKTNHSPLKLDIVPMKTNITLKMLLIDRKSSTISITIPKTPPKKESKIILPETNTNDTLMKKIVTINQIYLLIVGIIFAFVIGYQFYIYKLEKKHGKELDLIISNIEKSKNESEKDKEQSNYENIPQANQKTNQINQNEQSMSKPIQLNLPSIQNSNTTSTSISVLTKKSFDAEVIRKAVIAAKLKGLPKDLVIEHLSKKYNPKKVEQIVRMFY